jgi:catechol 1,2-dioxygenase
MPANLISKSDMKALAAKAAGLDGKDGNPRVKEVVNKLLYRLMQTIDELDITMDEFWAGVAYLGESAKANELGLLIPGVAIEHFLDLRLDEAERLAGLDGGTARTIEGPLYIAGAPLAKHEARLDDGTDDGETLFMEGQVPIPLASTHFSARRSHPTTCAAALRQTAKAAIASARSCPLGTAARLAPRPRIC